MDSPDSTVLTHLFMQLRERTVERQDPQFGQLKLVVINLNIANNCLRLKTEIKSVISQVPCVISG